MDATALPKSQKAVTLAGTMLALFLAALDQTIVATAGPSIQKSLHIEASLYVWITTSYLVASTVLVPVWGKLSDIVGRKRVLLTGIGIFLLGSVLCGVSQSAMQLILFRAVQGMGSASLFTSAFAIIGDLFTPRDRGRYQGLFGAVFGLSSVVGPLVGGFLTDNFGWHWCFFVNAPIGLIAVLFIIARMPPLAGREGSKLRLDVLGAVMLTVGLVPLLVALSLGKAVVREGETGFLWTSWQTLTLFGVAAVGIILFLVVESRAADPIVDLKLFRSRAFALGTLAAFAAGLTFLGAIVFLPLFMVNVVGERATGAGLTTLPLTFGIIVSNIASGQLTSKTGSYKSIILFSIVLQIAAFALFAFTLTPEETKLDVSWKMFLIGIGLGPSIPLFTLAIQNAVPPQVMGVASSLAAFSRQMGGVIGIAIAGTVFATTLSDELAAKMQEATKDLPPAMLAQMKQQQSEAQEEGSFDRKAIEEKIHAAFADQKSTVEKALRDNDAAAIAKLEANPMVDERLKAALQKGGIAAQVQAGFDAEAAKVKAALDKGPEGLAALEADPSTPPQLKENLAHIPPPALASPEARAQIEARLAAGMQQAADQAKQKAVDAALAKIDEGMAKGEATAVETVAKVERALKESFTDAVKRVYVVGMGMAVLALLAALIMPALPLRSRGGGPPIVVE